MRRKDLAVCEPADMDAIIQSCDCLRLGFADASVPYVVPLSFGYCRENGEPVFYVHSATEGRKVDLARKLKRAAFELDHDRAINPSEKPCDFSVRYGSVMGMAESEELHELSEKAAALALLMQKYSGKADWEFPEAVLAKTAVFRLRVTEMSGRAHG